MRSTIEMAREADLIDDSYASDWYVYQLKAFEALVRADEREACAKVADEADKYNRHISKEIAAAIRARGETK
jgi:hypothetical protein